MATVTTQERTNILKLVAGMFNAAPGAAYLNEFTDAYVALNKDLGALAAGLGQTGAFQSLYPSFLTADEFANKFLDTLGLKANTEAQDWVKAKVNAGESFASVIFQALVAIDASTSDDFKAAKDQLANKAAVAEYYSVEQNKSADDLGTLQNVVATVTNDPATVEAAKQGAAVASGQTFTLTTGPDNITGTSGDDTINGYVDFGAGTSPVTGSTFTAADQINGAGGTDTLNVTVENAGAAVNLPGATISNVEIVNARNISGQTLSIDANNIPGVTQINADRANSAVSITNLGKDASAGIIGNGVAANGALNVGYVAGTTAATINLAGGTKNVGNAAKIVVTTDTHTKVNLNSTGAANAVDTVVLATGTSAVTELNVSAATNLTTGNITGFTGTAAKINVAGAATKVDLGTLENATVKTVDASGLTAGGLTATLSTNAGIIVTGGKGSDVITTGGVLAGAGLVDAGDGKDTLAVASTAHITADAGKLYKNFEVLQVNNGADVNLTHLASTNSIGAVIINQTAAATGVSNMTAEQAANVTVKGAVTGANITFGVKDASKAGQIDTVKLTLDDGATTKASFVFDAPVLTGIEKLEIVANENFDIKALTAATALDSVKVTGAGTTTITTGAVNFAANSTFDFSGAEAKVVFDASGAQATGTTGLTIKGSTTAVNEIKDSQKADVITGGAKSDTVTFTGGSDTVTLGAAGDTFDFNGVKGNTAAQMGADGVTFVVATGDSVIKAGASGAFTAASAFDATVTDLITGFESGAAFGAGAGAKFTIDTDVAATGFKFGTALTFGTTTVDQAGDFFVLDAHGAGALAGNAYVFQDTNSNGVIDADDMMIKLVGDAQLTSAEFSVSGGNLVFVSA